MRSMFLKSVLWAFLIAVSSAVMATESTPTVSPAVETTQTNQDAASLPKVNLNTADEATLERDLVGVGAVRAKAIVAHRQANGPFTSIDQLLEVQGIGPAILEKNRARLLLD